MRIGVEAFITIVRKAKVWTNECHWLFPGEDFSGHTDMTVNRTRKGKGSKDFFMGLPSLPEIEHSSLDHAMKAYGMFLAGGMIQ